MSTSGCIFVVCGIAGIHFLLQEFACFSLLLSLCAAQNLPETTIDPASCPAGWIRYDDSCFYFMTERASFSQARTICMEEGAHLVSIGDEAENEFIARYRGSTDLAWIGLYRQTSFCYDLTSCDWMWIDGSQLVYYNWPSSALPTISRCIFMDPNGFWSNRLVCNAKLDVICEMSVIFPTVTQDECKWSRTNGKQAQNGKSCYLFVSEGMTFYEAKRSCGDEGAHLVSIGNEDENALVARLKQFIDVWIGLYRLTNDSCAGSSCRNWMWLDGNNFGYYKWTDNFVPNTSPCVLMNTADMWEHTRLCSTKLSFICKKSVFPTTTPEPTSWMTSRRIVDHTSSAQTTDHSSTYIGVGVFLGVFVIAVIGGVTVYLNRRRRQMKTKNAKGNAEKNVATGVTDYENIAISSSSNNHGLDVTSVSIGKVYENALTIEGPSRLNNHVDDTGNHPVYEKVTRDTDVSPEYTRLQVTDSIHTYGNE